MKKPGSARLSVKAISCFALSVLVALMFALSGCSATTLSKSHQNNYDEFGAENDPVSKAAGSLAKQLTANYSRSSPVQRIALLPVAIQYPNQRELAETFNDAIRVKLLQSGQYEVVADSDMKRAIAQIDTVSALQERGEIDRETLKYAGELANADAIMDGSITKIDYKSQRISVELINITTGSVVAAGQTVFSN